TLTDPSGHAANPSGHAGCGGAHAHRALEPSSGWVCDPITRPAPGAPSGWRAIAWRDTGRPPCSASPLPAGRSARAVRRRRLRPAPALPTCRADRDLPHRRQPRRARRPLLAEGAPQRVVLILRPGGRGDGSTDWTPIRLRGARPLPPGANVAGPAVGPERHGRAGAGR